MILRGGELGEISQEKVVKKTGVHDHALDYSRASSRQKQEYFFHWNRRTYISWWISYGENEVVLI